MRPPARRRHRCAAALLVAAAACARAEPVVYAIDPEHTRVWWEVRHFGTSTQRGRFDDVEGRIAVDRDSRQGEVSIRIATASVSSGLPALDRMLRSDRFLATDAYPSAYFVATRLAFDGGSLAAVRGEFTLRGCAPRASRAAVKLRCSARRAAATSKPRCVEASTAAPSHCPSSPTPCGC